MDDIYFSRKKKDGGNDRTPAKPSENRDVFSHKPEEEDYLKEDGFRLNFEKKPYQPAGSESDSKGVFSSLATPFEDYPSHSEKSPPIPDPFKGSSSVSSESRIPAELRSSGTAAWENYPIRSQTESKREEKKPVKKKAKKKFSKGKAVLCILLIVLICLSAFGISVLGKLDYKATEIGDNPYVEDIPLKSSAGVKNILFIGCDDAKGADYSRSDTMMLVSLDTVHKAIKLTSFLRDSYVYIPDIDRKAKLNAACANGGAEYLINTLEYNFEVRIDNYVLVDFKMFENIVNALGGIDVEIEEDEAAFLNRNCGNFYGKAKVGYNHLTGIQALDYCRIRKLDDDFYRTKRQRKVIGEIIKKCKSASVFNLFAKLDTIMQYVETDIPKAQLVSLGAKTVLSYLRYDIMQSRIPAGDYGDTWWYDTNSYGESIISIDVEENENRLIDFIYEQAPEKGKEKE